MNKSQLGSKLWVSHCVSVVVVTWGTFLHFSFPLFFNNNGTRVAALIIIQHLTVIFLRTLSNFRKQQLTAFYFHFYYTFPHSFFPFLFSLSLSLSLFSFGLELISIWKFVLTILAFFHAGSPDTLLNFIVIKLYAYYLRYYLKWLATSSSHSSWRFEPIISFSMNSQESVNLLIGMIET